MLKRLSIILLILLNVGCDQWSKGAVRKNVDYGERIELFGQNFTLTNIENTGAMLGWGQDLSPILKVIILQVLPLLLLMVLLIRILYKQNLNKWLVFAFACVIGGGIGNLMDRIAHGKVTDFFHIEIGFFKTGIFNMADVSVSLGMILILFLSFRKKQLDF